ncbi:MAG TPA: hypothetical protein VLM85_11745 [Polyangiaceae bacterium]|nr:hypothetical protein [Polyangiaceae bacterium]
MSDQDFSHSASFEHGEAAGNVRLGKLEMMYEELFAEVIEDGIITQEERQQLDKMADSLGLDKARLRKLEQALQAAYEARHQVVIKELYESEEDKEGPRGSLQAIEPPTDQRSLALQRRITFLEGRVAELEKQLTEARNNVAVEVDLSDVASTTKEVPEDDPLELQRRLRHDPRDEAALHLMYRVYDKKGDIDGKWCVAQALVYLNQANEAERAHFNQYRETALIKPRAALTADAWARLLAHPDEEPLVGEIFAVVAPAVLVGRLSALRRDKMLAKLDPTKRQDPATSTIQAVRCFAWAAAILGMSAPPLFPEPDFEGTVEFVPAMPPATRLGQKSLSGRSAAELAFIAGKHLAQHRAQEFMRVLIPGIADLEDIFLAALSIGNPGIPMNERGKQIVVPIAKAIEPILEPNAVDALRGHFLRFVEEGGRTNLQRWAGAVDRTCARAGLLLSNDLRAAHAVFELEDKSSRTPERSEGSVAHGKTRLDERMDDLLTFVSSDRYAKLRKQIGIAVGQN